MSDRPNINVSKLELCIRDLNTYVIYRTWPETVEVCTLQAKNKLEALERFEELFQINTWKVKGLYRIEISH